MKTFLDFQFPKLHIYIRAEIKNSKLTSTFYRWNITVVKIVNLVFLDTHLDPNRTGS